MSFTSQEASPLFAMKLTELGRRKLASGQLTFDYFSFGDSDVTYSFGNESWRPANERYDIRKNKTLNISDRYSNIAGKLTPSNNASPSVTGNSLTFLVGNPEQIDFVNQTPARGFFSGDTSFFYLKTDYNYLVNHQSYTTFNDLSGSNSLKISGPSTSSRIPLVGDKLLIAFHNPNFLNVNFLESPGAIVKDKPKQYLWYNIDQVNSGSDWSTGYMVTLDRNIPNFNSAGTGRVRTYLYPSGRTLTDFYATDYITEYWSNELMSFEEQCLKPEDEVRVWNMNLVFYDSIVGTTTTNNLREYLDYNSSIYNGIKSFIGLNDYKTCLGVIHYSNNFPGNTYGEYLVDSSPSLNIPTIIPFYGDGVSIGLNLTANTTEVSLNNINVKGRSLNDNLGNSYGYVINAQKMFVITDEELVAAMTYKSNRNYMLNSVLLQLVPSGMTSVISSGETMWLTYMFYNENAFTSRNLGVGTGLPCQKIAKIDSNGSYNITAKVEPSAFMTNVLSAGTGFNGQQIIAILQKTTGSNSPNPNDWKFINITDQLVDYNIVSSSTINPVGLSATTFTISQELLNATTWQIPGKLNWFIFWQSYAPGDPNVETVRLTNPALGNATAIAAHNAYTAWLSAQIYNQYPPYDSGAFLINDWGFNLPSKSNTNAFGIGDEFIFFGNVNTNIGATAFRTSFRCQALLNAANESSNLSWDSGSTFITEVGILDKNENLVAIAKASRPIEKNSLTDLIIRLDYDF